MKLKNYAFLLFFAAVAFVTTSCEPDRYLEETSEVIDSGSENNKEIPRDPDED